MFRSRPGPAPRPLLASKAAPASGWATRWRGALSVAVQLVVASTGLGLAWPAAPLPGPSDGAAQDQVLDLAANEGPGRLPLRPCRGPSSEYSRRSEAAAALSRSRKPKKTSRAEWAPHPQHCIHWRARGVAWRRHVRVGPLRLARRLVGIYHDLCMYLSVCLPLRLFACLLACLFVCFCVLTCLSVNLLICFCLVTHTSVYPCTHLCTYHFASSLPLISLSLFVSLIACSFVRWSGRPSVCLSVCLPVCLSVCLSLSPPSLARSLVLVFLSFS